MKAISPGKTTSKNKITPKRYFDSAKMIDMRKYHNAPNLVKRFYQSLQFSNALLSESDKALKNCR